MAIVEPKSCDRSFERSERQLRQSVEYLRGSAKACTREAASELARACSTVGDPNASALGKFLRECLRGEGDFSAILDGTHEYIESNRRRVNFERPSSPLDLIFVSCGSLEQAADALVTGNIEDLLRVASYSVMSRASSGDVLSILHRFA